MLLGIYLYSQWKKLHTTISYPQRRVGGAKQLTVTLCRANHEADNSNSVHALTTVPLTNNTIQVNFA